MNFFHWRVFVCQSTYLRVSYLTPDRRQPKTLILLTKTIDKCILKIARNNVFDYHISINWWQMAIKNTFPSNFWSVLMIVKSVFDCHLSDVCLQRVKDEYGR